MSNACDTVAEASKDDDENDVSDACDTVAEASKDDEDISDACDTIADASKDDDDSDACDTVVNASKEDNMNDEETDASNDEDDMSESGPGDQAYTCDLCPSQFKSKSNFKLHQRIHTGAKLHACELCTERFSLKSSLNQHMKVRHKDERRFPCEVCNYQFTRQGRRNMNRQ